MDRYVCPPWYDCECEPGKPVSLSSMKRHRKQANQVRAALGRGPFKRGPKVTPNMSIPYQFQCHESLEEHDTDDESCPTQGRRSGINTRAAAREFRIANKPTNLAHNTMERVGTSQNQLYSNAFSHGSSSGCSLSIGRETQNVQMNDMNSSSSIIQDDSRSVRGRNQNAIGSMNTRQAHTTRSESPQESFPCQPQNVVSDDPNQETENLSEGSESFGNLIGELGTAGSEGNMHLLPPTEEGHILPAQDVVLETNEILNLVDDEFSKPEDVSQIPGFFSWLQDNQQWVDLYQTHGLPKLVMNHILKIIQAPCKNWETVIDNITKVTGLQSSLQMFDVCPGHNCLVNLHGQEGTPSCTICGISRTAGIADELLSSLKPVAYMPILPRVAKLVKNERTCNELYSYVHDSVFEGGTLSDFFGSPMHKELISSFGGVERCRYDIFLTVSTDGFQVYKNMRCDVWPILTVLMDLPPTQRYSAWNVLPLMFIPGGSEPKDLQSFLIPFVNQLNSIYEQGGVKLKFFDGVERCVRIHLVWFTSDLAALKKVASLTGVKGKTPCRFCDIQGLYVPAAKGYYFPSWVYVNDNRSKKKSLFDIRRISLRTPQSVEAVIVQLEQASTQREKELISRETGIQGKSVLCEIPGVKPFSSFPPDIMHLFYNVQRLLLKILLGTVPGVSIGDGLVAVLDQELLGFGDGISGQMSPRPRKLSDWKNWKAAENKSFTLGYLLVLFDGHLSNNLMDCLYSFVELADICFRYAVTTDDTERAFALAIEFVEQYENAFMQHKESRANFCTYVVHLLLHLGPAIEQSGPLICCSQYWVEKYLGWISHRLHARYLPAESFSKAALFTDSYKLFYGQAFRRDYRDELHEKTLESGGYKFLGVTRKRRMTPRLRRLLSDYLNRKYDELDIEKARGIASGPVNVHGWKKVRFVSGGGTQTASVLQEMSNKRRPSYYVAVEMDCTENSASVFYGRLLEVLSVRVDFSLDPGLNTNECSIQRDHKVAVIDWALGLVKGRQDQVFQVCSRKHAFRAASMEEVSVLQRLIGVIEHVVPPSTSRRAGGSQTTRARGGMRTYFIDALCREHRLLNADQRSSDGINRNLKGF